MTHRIWQILMLIALSMSETGVARGDLVAYFPFESDFDSVVGGYTGTANGDAAITTTAAIGSGSLQLDGDGDYIDIGAGLPLGTDSFSWAMWVKLQEKRGDTSSFRHQLVETSPEDPTAQLFVDRYGKLGFVATGGSGDKFSTDTVDNDQWHHVAVVADRTNETATLYIDGIPNGGVQPFTAPNSLTHPYLTTLIGHHHNVAARDAQGLIDDVQFYNEALSDDQIAQLATGSMLAHPGDANFDGVVNAADAAILASNWLADSGVTWFQGDFNGDGIVGDIDATILATNWQSPATSSAAVPEPTMSVLLLAAIGGLLIGFRR